MFHDLFYFKSTTSPANRIQRAILRVRLPKIEKSPFPASEIPKKVTPSHKFLHLILKLLLLHSIDTSNKKL